MKASLNSIVLLSISVFVQLHTTKSAPQLNGITPIVIGKDVDDFLELLGKKILLKTDGTLAIQSKQTEEIKKGEMAENYDQMEKEEQRDEGTEKEETVEIEGENESATTLPTTPKKPTKKPITITPTKASINPVGETEGYEENVEDSEVNADLLPLTVKVTTKKPRSPPTKIIPTIENINLIAYRESLIKRAQDALAQLQKIGQDYIQFRLDQIKATLFQFNLYGF